MLRTFAVILALLILSNSNPVSADEIGLISIDSPGQLDRATEILGSALARVGNDYLVQADPYQLIQLARAGFTFELVMSQTDRTELALSLSENPEGFRSVDLARTGPTIELDAFTQLVKLSPTLARSLSESSEAKIIPLEDQAIRFHYDPPINKNPLLALLDFPTDSIADLVSQDSVYAFDQHLQDFNTRYVWTAQIDQARDWMKSKFQAWGYTNVSSQSLYWNSGWHDNVMVVKLGYAEPDKVIVVGGHYDSWNSQSDPYTYAPGADDNGSGTTLTLELARVLADIPLRKTIIFMPFTAEEVGLVGSSFAAGQFADDGTDIEVMFNFDMVGYDPGNGWLLELQSGPNDAYLDLHAQAAARVTSLVTTVGGMGSNSDHYSFHREGFTIVNNIEGNFNYPGWHTDEDLTSNMNFDFFTDVVRAAAASISQIAQSPLPQTVDFIADVGDGQSLEISWSDCAGDYTYNVYYGTYFGARTDSVIGISGVCSYLVTGLTTGQVYHFQVFAETPEGYQSPYAVSGSERPLVIPRAPTGLQVSPDLGRLELEWWTNIELDLASYNLYRKEGESGAWGLYQAGLILTSFSDLTVTGGIEYSYRLTAVDNSLNESGFSNIGSAYPATFDQGVLIVDETREERWVTPDQLAQQAWFDTIFSGATYGLTQIDSFPEALTRSEAGQYSSIFWLDEDYSYKEMLPSTDSLLWYLSYDNNIFMSGWQTVWGWSNHNPFLSPGEILYDEFMLDSYVINIGLDFVGAFGQAGWPTVAIDPGRGYMRLSMVPKLNPRSGAEVIYTFDSFTDNPDFEGQPAGLAYDGPNGKRVVLAFPLYFLTPESATNVISKAMEYFGEEVVIAPGCGEYTGGYPGNTDCDTLGVRSLGDITRLFDRAYISQTPLCIEENGNVTGDASGNLNLADLLRLNDFIYVSQQEFPPCGSAITPSGLDSGVRDSLIVLTSQPEAGGDDSTFVIELYAWHDVEEVAIQIGIRWESSLLTLDSAVASPAVDTLFEVIFLYDQADLSTANANHRVLFAGASYNGSQLPVSSSRQLLATYYFSISDWDVDSLIVVRVGGWDTFTEPLFVIDAGFDEYSPALRAGADSMVISDVNGCPEDSDGDGVTDCDDICPGFDDLLDGDSDTWPDGCDNCPTVANPGQEDINGNNLGDACEPCCGFWTGGYTGNTNCDTEGKRNLADITKLIDHVYINKPPLCCFENGDVAGEWDGKINLADITTLIDHVYVSKDPTIPCQ